ncbi:MAG: hypothetical protein R6X17_15465 [Candidatus Competibacteraceae bacterium]
MAKGRNDGRRRQIHLTSAGWHRASAAELVLFNGLWAGLNGALVL